MICVIDEILCEIKERVTLEDFNFISNVMSTKLYDYDFVKKETSLTVYETDESEEMIRKFLVTKKIQGLSSRSLKRYQNDLKRVFYTIGKPIKEVTSDDIKYFLACLQIQNGCSAVTINNYRLSLSTFYSFCVDEQIIKISPMRTIKRIKVPKKNKKAFSNIDIEMLRIKAQRMARDMQSKRLIAIIETLLSTGARASELCGLDITDINFNTGEVLIREGKGGKDRIVYLNDASKVRLSDYLMSRTDNNVALFVSIDKPHNRLRVSGLEIEIRNLGKAANIEDTHPHRFRRTCATMLNKRGMAISEISIYLGHESVATTQIYIQMNAEQVKQSHIKYMN
ncbi:MAG: tyrosine-type recombinase/integrase [Clostridium sp.]